MEDVKHEIPAGDDDSVDDVLIDGVNDLLNRFLGQALIDRHGHVDHLRGKMDVYPAYLTILFHDQISLGIRRAHLALKVQISQ